MSDIDQLGLILNIWLAALMIVDENKKFILVMCGINLILMIIHILK